MKFSKTLIASSVAAVMAAGFMAPAQAAEVEVGASVGVANMYYWRGQDLGNGDAAVWGDLNISSSGAYAGIWASSGDSVNGTEFDLYAGYGGSVGEFSYDLSVWSYVYPSAPGSGDTPQEIEDSADAQGELDNLSEVILSLGYGPVALTYYDNIAGAAGYSYLTLGASVGAFSFTYGRHDDSNFDGDSPSHFDISYAYNDNLSFTLGLSVEEGDAPGFQNDEDPKFVVSYTLPLGE